VETRKTLEGELGNHFKKIENFLEGEQYILKINRDSFSDSKEDTALERTMKKSGVGITSVSLKQLQSTIVKEPAKLSDFSDEFEKQELEYDSLCKQVELKRQELQELNSQIVSFKKRDTKNQVNQSMENKGQYVIKINGETDQRKKLTNSSSSTKHFQSCRFTPFGGMGLFFKKKDMFSFLWKK
jgi:hypothetical protein